MIKRANNSQFGLASGLWAKDVDVVNTISRGLRAGTVWVNCCELLTVALLLMHLRREQRDVHSND